MDKLQPLIRNRFWILVGLVIPLVLYGYYSANGAMKKATAEREETLNQVKGGVSAGNEPNEDYIKKLTHINSFLEASVQDAIIDIWRKQQARMTWPQAVANRVPKDFMGEFDRQVPFIYMGLYPELIRRLQLRAQPVEPVAQATGTNPMGPMIPTTDPSGRPIPQRQPTSTPNQKLILAGMVPHAKFGKYGITSQEMWDAQIDIWMTELLIDAIVKMNEDKESISESVIRRVDVIELMGGSGEPVTKDAPAGGAEGGFEGGMPGMGGMAQQQIPTDIAFPPAEEFGAASDAAAGGGDMAMSMDSGSGMMAAVPPKRYIAETEEAPYLERGFYMSVIIQQTKIADFVTTLVNSDWPIQVRRFQVGMNPYRTDINQFNNMNNISGMGFEGGFSSPGAGMGGMNMGGVGRFSGGESGISGMGRENTAAAIPNIYGANIPEYAMGALNHPDLVRLDICGVITMYRQPKEVMEAVAARQAAEAANQAQSVETTPPVDAAPMAPVDPADPAAPVVPSDDPAAPVVPSNGDPVPGMPASEAGAAPGAAMPAVPGGPVDPAAPVPSPTNGSAPAEAAQQ